MFETLNALAANVSGLFAAAATGAVFTATVPAAATSFDRLDYARADAHVRQLLLRVSAPAAAAYLAAAALAVLAMAFGAAILAGLAALGLIANRWTLAPRRKGEGAPGVRQRKKTQRLVAVSLSNLSAGVGGIAALLALLRV